MQHLRRLLCDAFHSYFAKFITKGRTHWGGVLCAALSYLQGTKVRLQLQTSVQNTGQVWSQGETGDTQDPCNHVNEKVQHPSAIWFTVARSEGKTMSVRKSLSYWTVDKSNVVIQLNERLIYFIFKSEKRFELRRIVNLRFCGVGFFSTL